MDFADDIAYSTYDLEDAFKAEFLCPLGMLVKTRLRYLRFFIIHTVKFSMMI